MSGSNTLLWDLSSCLCHILPPTVVVSRLIQSLFNPSMLYPFNAEAPFIKGTRTQTFFEELLNPAMLVFIEWVKTCFSGPFLNLTNDLANLGLFLKNSRI